MDREGIERLYLQYASLVYRTCLAILVDHHDAEDAAQEVFAKLLAQDRTTAVSDPRKWLLQVTRNHCIDRRRAAARRRAATAEAGAEARRSGVEDAEERSVARAQIRWLFSLLPRREREVLVRQAMLDENLDSVAARMGISYGAAAQVVYRARRLLLQANERFGAGIAVACGKLGAAARRLRELALRSAAGGREWVGRNPLDAALALPIVLLVALLGGGPAGNRHGATVSPLAAVGPMPMAAVAVSVPVASRLAGTPVLRGTSVARAANPQGAAAAAKNVTPPGQIPPLPPPVNWLFQCRQIGAVRECPPVRPQAVGVVPTPPSIAATPLVP